MHTNLLKEIERAEEMLADNAKKLEKASLSIAEEKTLRQERKRLEKYKSDLLAEWRHLNS